MMKVYAQWSKSVSLYKGKERTIGHSDLNLLINIPVNITGGQLSFTLNLQSTSVLLYSTSRQ